ncbi:MAG TPA: DMT family transporter [Acidimicrobiia bacterium]|nr:DMT family transporter [Acidimicrobiia bacterium]
MAHMTGPVRDLIWEDDDLAEDGRRLTRPAIYLLLATVVLVLGLNWPIMATALESITPIWMGVFRVAGAAAVVTTIGAVQGKMSVPPRRDLPMIVSLAVFRLAAVFVLVFTALELVPPGRSSVVVWTTSLWTVPIAAVFLGERMSGRRWVGLALGVAGVVVLFEPWAFDWEEPGVALGHALLILAAITNAATSVHIRGHRWTITPLEAIPWQLLGAAVPLVALGLIVDGPPVIDWTPQLVWIVLYQGMLATGIAFWAQIVILRNFSAVSTNLTLMAVPVVGVVSSAVLLGEDVTTALGIGLVLVIAGVALNLLSDSGTPEEIQPSEVV